MAYDFTNFKQKTAGTVDWLKNELLSIQTGRATPVILDGVLVDSYGSKMHINQLATVGTEDARTLRITPWDTDSIQNIESALRDADLGVGVAVDEKGLRVSFPELTTETREKYVKVVKNKLEDSKVSLRSERDEVWNEIQKLEKDGEMGEDEKFRLKQEMEKITKSASDQLDQLADRKGGELLK